MTSQILARNSATVLPHLPAMSLLPQTSVFEARLSMPRVKAEPEPELTLRKAFESLVSAACYLSLSQTGESAAILEAIQMLQDFSQEMLEEGGLDLGSTPDAKEDLIWENKQRKWECRNAAQEAVWVMKPSSEIRYSGKVRYSGKIREPRSAWARWWGAWLGTSHIQRF